MRTDAPGLIAEALGVDVAEVQPCVDVLRPLSAGGLKSCLQKIIRFRAKEVQLSEEAGKTKEAVASSALVAATCVALLFGGKGTFSPELQLFTRGVTSALKRMAIILVEDAWVPGGERAVQVRDTPPALPYR